MKNVLMVGYWGGFNVGDEGFLEIVLPRLMNIANVTVASKNPENTTNNFHVNAIKAEPKSLLNEIKRSDVVLEGPGGLYQDATSFKSLFYYASAVFMAKHFRKKVYLYGIGIGPIKRHVSEQLTKKAFSMADGRFVRDKFSYEWLMKRGIQSEYAADVVFTAASEQFKGYKPGHDSVLYIPSHKWENLDVDQVDGSMVIFFPGKDMPITAASGGDFIDGLQLGIAEILKLFKEYKGAVVGRLHAGILATIAGLPFVCIPYDVKLSEYAKELSAALDVPEDAIVASNITEAKAKLSSLLENASEVSDKLIRFSLAQKERADRMMHYIEGSVL
ncbi:polysaccharide pyruvyl transferase CsaB [Coprothermobacter platensis]|uniref:polysaccharide pyruvyl transferase CsaB n=1 Tax=Coprothermobacter platensis TaxID=108819 RepID=UPI00036ADBC5|nr:polysaccharide pyruvyl transferase CsaB [Coprothermobacter platensis]